MHTESQPPCKDGFYGPLCGLCQPAWYLANGGCEPCDGYRSNSSGSDDSIGNGATGSGEQGSGSGDWGSGGGGARRLAEGDSNDGMFKIKAYTAATHRVNFSVWVRWGLILAACVSGLIIVLWNTTGDPLEAEAKKKKQQERLKAVGTKLAARFGRTGKGKAKPSKDEDAGSADESAAAAPAAAAPAAAAVGTAQSVKRRLQSSALPASASAAAVPPSPPPSPPGADAWDAQAMGHMRSSLQQLGVSEGSGVSLGDLFSELKTGIGEKAKIMITHFQISTSLKYTVHLSWPAEWTLVSSVDGWFSWVNMDVSQLAKWECYYPINFYDKLFMSVMLPSFMMSAVPLTCLALLAFQKLQWKSGRRQMTPKAQRIRSAFVDKVWYVFLFMTFFFFPPVSKRIFSTLHCAEMQPGEKYLWEDLSVRCGHECISGDCAPDSEEARWVSWFMFALAGMLVYTAGIPIFLGLIPYSALIPTQSTG
eukprot:Transcript_6442.p2 GENE.Transcript_6442~~Transcript_6442.p2  ORF type:complete len:478 (+),score=134.69 Transcript_6442:1752-3185(+)